MADSYEIEKLAEIFGGRLVVDAELNSKCPEGFERLINVQNGWDEDGNDATWFFLTREGEDALWPPRFCDECGARDCACRC